MGKLGAGSWIVVGIALLVLGWLLQSRLLEFLLDIAGWIFIIMGIITIILGGVNLMFGKKGGAGNY